MNKKSPPVPLPPLSIKVLVAVEKIEQYAQQLMYGCGDGASFNPEKAIRILRTCAAESFDVQATYYASLSGYCPRWLDELHGKTLLALLGLIGNRYFSTHQRDQVDLEVRRTLDDGLEDWKRKNNPSGATGHAAKSSEANTDHRALDRRALIDGFIVKVTDAGRKIERKDIWMVAGYNNATEFERFQRCSLRTTKTATANFNRVLSMQPQDFIRLLARKASR